MTDFISKITGTSVHDHGSETLDATVFHQSTNEKFWQELGKDARIALDAVAKLVTDGTLPKLDLHKSFAEYKIESDAKEAAEIIARRGDLGTDYQKRQLEEMFQEAKRNGTEKELIAAINKDLAEKDCPYRLKLGRDFMQANSWPGNRNTDVLSLVTTTGIQMTVDQLSISDNSNKYAQ